MKPLQGDTITHDSCSCISCNSKSESDRQTLRRLVAQGSRLNRLFYGKYYIPLRESKLLDRLVRTRALYDALRSQLLSSSLSVSSKADLKPRQSPIEDKKALEEAKKSSDIFALVDLVDKGAVLGSKKLSECCSCCTCASKARLHENVQRGRRNRQAHAGGNIASRSSLASKQENGEAKNIKSDPCTSASKHEDLTKLQSREILKKICPEPIYERDRFLTASSKHKLISLNNSKLRKSYHKLKRSKAYPYSYMENIGEGSNKIRKLKQSRDDIKKMKSTELLKLAQQKIKESFNTELKDLEKFKSEESSMFGNIAEENMIRKDATKLKDKDGGKRQAQDSGLKQRSRKNNQVGKENISLNYSSSTSTTSIWKEKNKTKLIKTGTEQQKSPLRKRNKNNNLAGSHMNVDIIKKKLKEPRAIEGPNQTQKSKDGSLLVSPQKKRSFKSMTTLVSVASTEVVNKTERKQKQSPFSKTQRKDPIKSNTTKIPRNILKSVSTSSIEKSYSTSNKNSNARQALNKKSSLNLLDKSNKIKLKPNPTISFHKRLRLLSAPMRFKPEEYALLKKPRQREPPRVHQEPQVREEPKSPEEPRLREETPLHEKPRLHDGPGRQKKPTDVNQKHMIKNIQAGSHALKHCLCSLKIKVKNTKSKVSKKFPKESPKIKVTQSIHSKNLLSSVKSLIKASNLTVQDTKHISNYVSKCECITKSQSHVIRKKKRGTQYQMNTKRKSISKHNITDQSQAVRLSASISECSDTYIECKEKRGFKYKPGQPNIHFGIKSTSNHVSNKIKGKWKIQDELPHTDSSHTTKSSTHASKCECFDTNISSEEKRESKDKGQSSNRLRTKSTSKDASITTKEKRRLQNHSVQTVNNITPKQKRGVKFYPDYSTHSTDSETKSTISHVSKEMKESSLKQRQNNKPYTSNSRFSIELSGKGYSNHGLKINQSIVKGVHRSGDRTKQIKNKQSQISNSTGKSKYTATKHGLRRCFCTLKLGYLEKKKNNQRKLSKRTMIQPDSIPESSQTKLKIKNVSISTERAIYHSLMKQVILPYECDSSFCGPKKHYSHDSKEILTNREERKMKKYIKANAHKSRSHSSLTSRSVQLPIIKKIHSALVYHKSETLIPILKKNKTNLPDISQQVRPSFARRFLNSKRSSRLYASTKKGSKIKKETKIRSLKDLEPEGDIKIPQKSLPLKNKKQDRGISLSPTIKRCLCTLKLHKKGRLNKKSSAIIKMDTKSNMIAEETFPNFQRDSKLKQSNHLRPYESKYSKPISKSIFVSRDCNPYECLEKVKKRNTFKNFGVVTQKSKMKSKSSDTRALGSTSNLLFVKSDFKQQKTSLQKIKNMVNLSELSHLPKRAREMYPEKPLKQGFKIGSNFSFNIQFYKGITPENDLDQKNPKNMNVHFLNDKQEVKLLTNRYSDNLKSRLKTRVSPKTSRCFCALKLLKKDEQHRGSKLLTSFAAKKSTQIYTVSTVTVAETKIKTPEILLLKDVDHDYHCVDSYDPTSYTKKAHTDQWKYFNRKSTCGFSISSIALKTKQMQSYIRESKCKLMQISPTSENLLKFASKETIRFESQFSCEINYLNNSCSKKDQILKCAQSQNETLALNPESKNTPDIIKEIAPPSQLTGVQPLLRRCYCTMNIQVAGQQSPKRRHHHHNSSKLKDYECEPGVCIPYECDPYECQKMIMKRLMKKVSRMSGTENRLRTSSSLTSSMSSSSKTRKLQSSLAREQRHRAAKVRPVGLKYQTLPRSPPTQRQAVRVGSAFSFDIEFSKQSKAPAAEIIKVPRRSTASRSSKTSYRHRKDRGTRGVERDRRHRESQSMMTQMRHRASSVTPMLKRCFCTLKLQKKGRQQKQRELQGIHQGTSTPPKFKVEKPILRTTETSQNTKQRYHELLPYECEPGICVPGECDPYACLELIKKRRGKQTKDFGTDSIASRLSSSSSMTPSQKRRRKQIQSRNVRVKPIKSRDTAVRSKPSIMSIERQVMPSRQAVKLGSSFSFNIEFFKDKTSTPIDRRSPEVYVHKTPKEVRKVPKHVYVQRKMRESFSQDGKSTRDTDSQIGLLKHGQSTMTSAFLKRCFCTAKLQGINVDQESRARQHQSFATLKRCFCTLKMLTASKREHKKPNNVGHERATPPLPDKQVVKTQTRVRSPALLPYECEPGVCVPGYCDPHECEKLIRKRRAKEKMAGTTGPRTRSTSSSFTSSKTSKAAMAQSKSPRPPEKVRRREVSPREMVVREKIRTPVLPRRQAVKIGSSFSFDIEFYKDKFPNYHQVQAAATTVKKSRPVRNRGRGVNYGTRTRDRGLRGRRSSAQTRESQMDAAKRKDIAIGPMLRRCFCTLKLNKQKPSKNNKQKPSKNNKQKPSKNNKQKPSKASKQKPSKVIKDKPTHQATATPVVKEIPTLQTRSVMTANKFKALPYKLEPYECEPGVCVPGECDPYECEKRIKKRLMNSSGTLTEHHPTKSTSNMTKHRHRHRDSEAQSAMQRTKPMKTRDIQHKVRRPEYRSTVVERPSKQAVKIGSSFSFDIEFFKDKSPAGSVVSSRPVKQYAAYEKPRRTTSRSTEWRSISSRNKRAQRSKAVRDMDSQVLARKMRSTMTGVGPFLKRCFCTLQLHKSEKQGRPFDSMSVTTKTEKVKAQPKVEANSAEKSTHTKKQAKHHGRKLEPYECEPGVCVPGQCDPYECEKRIKRRMQSKQSGTETHKGRSISSSIGETTKYRPRRTQARSYSPTPRNIKTLRDDDQFRGEDRVIYDTSPNRQAVRIGSSFSFNIEFYKDQSPQFPSIDDANKIIRTDMRGTETRSTRTRSMSTYGKGYLRDCQSQSECIKTDCKGSCAPLLKRCFCTLKLQKMGKQQQYTKIKIEPTTKSTGTRTKTKNKVEVEPVAREIGTKTKKYSHALEPYECEPGVCVPGQCDPYECEKRIKLRNMKHLGTGTTGASMKSMSSLTSRDIGTKAMNTKFCKDKCNKKRSPSTETLYRFKRSHRPSRAVENLNRQVVRLGSNFSFNMAFTKETSSGQGESYDNEIQTYYKPAKYKSKASISTANGIKSKTQGSHGREQFHSHGTTQAGAQMESKGSGVGPLLKRCFCTLTLQRAEVKNRLNSPVPKSEPTKVKTSDKKTSTKKKYNPPPAPTEQLDPDECEPGVCVPGECNPYECLERIKRRGIRRMSRTTGTRMKRASQVSASSMAAQFIPGYTSKRTQFKEESYPPQKIDRIVEEPRFPFFHANTRQGVRISSNFNINIEFFKETLPPTMNEDAAVCPRKEICRAKDMCVECTKPNRLTRIGYHGTRNDLRSNESQSEPVKTEDKSSAVAMLRRCFCTAKLHRSHLARSNHPQSLTVGRVEEIRPVSVFGPKEYWVQYQIQHPTKKNNHQGLETIMSYIPSKYNKSNNNKSCFTRKCKFCRPHSPVNLKKKGTQGITKDSETNQSTLKKMLYCCKSLFTKRSSQRNDKISEEKTFKPAEAIKKATHKQPWIDILKPSKSERHPNKAATADIKKTKSLKVAKVSRKDDYKKKYSRFQSGDADQKGTIKSQNKGMEFVKKMCPHCQDQFKQANPILKKVRFASIRNDKAFKPKDTIITEQLNAYKPISLLFKSRKFKNSEDVKYVKLCSCCGGIKKKRILPASQGANNKLLKNNGETVIIKEQIPLPTKTVMPKEFISSPKSNIVTPKEKIALPQENRKKNKQPCPCCVCRKNKSVANNRPRPKMGKKGGPCVCGSVICKKDAERRAETMHLESRKYNRKKCVCGTPICEAESEKEAIASESGYKRARKQRKREKKQKKEAKIREKLYKAEDKEINERRLLKEKYMLKKLKKYKDTPDAMLVAESVLDVGKLGITSAGDILRNLHRAVFDPKRTYRKFQSYLRDPMRAWKKFQDAADHGPGVATLQRIKLRCQAMKFVKETQEKLEEHPVTNFVIHSQDADPKKRFHPRKPAWRRRPDPSFGCSPFMLSLRKRPWLSVYYKCSWFYPHCLTLLQIWRQFMDIILFLLAVAVWSPCILGMELCRGLMCCFLCTG